MNSKPENTVRSISGDKVWRKYYSREALSLSAPEKTAYAYLKQVSAGRMNKVAVNYYGKKITFAKLFENIEKTAKAFCSMGVKKGDIVSFVSVAIPETIYSIYALNMIGATANTIDPRMDTQSIVRMINESDSEYLFIMDVAFAKIKDVLSDIAQKKIIVQSAALSLPYFKSIAFKMAVKTSVPYSEAVIKWSDFIKNAGGAKVHEAEYDGDRTVAITYTGGTTGFPKGVMLTNDSVNAVAFNFKYAGLAQNEGDKFLGIIPVFTSYGMVCGMHMPLCLGLELIPVPRFVPTELGALVRKYRPNHMISTPAFYDMMMNSKEVRDLDLSFLITMGSGGDTMNEGLEKKLGEFMREHNIKYPLAQGYGMSEVSAAVSFCVNDIYKSASVGIPSILNTVSVFDEKTGEEKGYNEVGEICIKGPSVMKGYFKREEETAEILKKHDDGDVWVHSGDLGYIDEDGFIFIIGRVKRMITRFDGHKVFPVNMESLICEKEYVRNCCVIGIDDREHSQGQWPFAIVELDPLIDKEARKNYCSHIFDICNEKLEERGRPVGVIAIDTIPLTGAGKNDYRMLEKEYKNFDYTML